MTDGNLMHEPPENAGAAPVRNWASLREQVRAIIRDEVDKLNPTDDARRALELIIESSLRYAEVDGQLKLTVVGHDGQPRTVDRNGQRTAFTMHDLLEELRVSHPVLFRSPARPDPTRRVAEEAGPAAPGAMAVAREPETPQRDWLSLGSSDTSPPASDSPPGGGSLFQLHRGKARLHGWSRKALAPFAKPADRDASVQLQFAPYGLALAKDRARNVIRDVRARPVSHQRGFALGAMAVAALLGIGVFTAFFMDDSPQPQASTEGPLVTGAISPAPAAPPPAATASRSRTLRGVPDVIDTATLSLEGEVVRLFGVEWAPGGGKPEDLTSYLKGREVACEPAGPDDTYRCQVGEQDLSRVVLFNGGGKPTAEATPDLKAAAAQAREAKIGVWRQQ